MKQKAHRQAGFSLRPIEWPRFAAASGKLVPLAFILSLTGCASSPHIVVPEIIRQPIYIPIPATLTNPVSVNLGKNPTWGSALGAYNEALQTCNASLNAIKTLKSPAPPSSQGSDKPPYK